MILLAVLGISAYAQKQASATRIAAGENTTIQTAKDSVRYKVTFIELGSVRCIPCQKMQLVMKAIEEKYGDKVKIEFHDVWTPKGKPFADKYDIKAIPTQVLLDESGKEFYRHEGYIAEEELVKILNGKNVR
jgi:thioredoxin 1